MARMLRLDIVSDTICPWCYVGKRRVAAALPLLAAEGLAFDLVWRLFQLNPAMPKEGVDRRAYRIEKFGSWEHSQALDARVAEAGRADGLVFRHDLMARTPNTLASHALIRFAHETGGAALQDRVVEALFAAYFTEGRDIGDPAVLAEIGAGAGLEPAWVLAAVSDGDTLAAVAREDARARQAGIDGVPAFLVEGYFLTAGAQPVPVLAEALRQASAALAGKARPARAG